MDEPDGTPEWERAADAEQFWFADPRDFILNS